MIKDRKLIKSFFNKHNVYIEHYNDVIFLEYNIAKEGLQGVCKFKDLKEFKNKIGLDLNEVDGLDLNKYKESVINSFYK